jgi:hypothetical protein
MRNASTPTLTNPPPSQPVSIPGCEDGPKDSGCPWQRFELTVKRAIDFSKVDLDGR